MSFLVLVPTKRVPDTDGVIRVTPDGLDVDTSHLSFVINPFDAIAVCLLYTSPSPRDS